MTPLTTEELLKTRFLVIADYPGSKFEIGKVIIIQGLERSSFFYAKYPHLFRKLEWGEERMIEEMPEYVKSPLWVAKVKSYDFKRGKFIDEDNFETQLRTYEPATLEEYNLYLKQTTTSEGNKNTQ